MDGMELIGMALDLQAKWNDTQIKQNELFIKQFEDMRKTILLMSLKIEALEEKLKKYEG